LTRWPGAAARLAGRRVVLEPLRSDHAEPMRNAAADPVVWRWMPIEGSTREGFDRWFAENTFHSREFKDVGRLVDLKRQQGRTISLGLPTLNEGQTIGGIIEVMQRDLVEEYPLLDEIVVIDSGSTDDTAAIARSLGVRVHQHPDVLPEYGTFRGKGEALWKSLHLLAGDLVAWCGVHGSAPGGCLTSSADGRRWRGRSSRAARRSARGRGR